MPDCECKAEQISLCLHGAEFTPDLIYIVKKDTPLQLVQCSLMKSRLNFIIKILDSNTRLSCRLILKF